MEGSIRQSVACFERPHALVHGDETDTVLMVPGLFVKPGALSSLGRKLHRHQFAVHYSSTFPYYNTRRLDLSAEILLRDLMWLRHGVGVKSLWLVAHSNGGLISLLALAAAEQIQAKKVLDMVRGVITMSVPFGGSPVARMVRWAVPAARDIVPGAPLLDRVRKNTAWVRYCLYSGSDYIVPLQSQQLPDAPFKLMEDFEHMDYFVGREEKINRTAGAIAGWINNHGDRQTGSDKTGGATD